MKRLLAGAALAAACLAGSGCLVVATAAAVGALAVSTNKVSDKPAKAAVETPAPVAAPEVVAAPVAPPAAELSQSGVVVVMDMDHGTSTKLPWQEGMTLSAAVAAEKSGTFHTARIRRGTRELPADLRQSWTADLALLAGDVVELRR